MSLIKHIKLNLYLSNHLLPSQEPWAGDSLLGLGLLCCRGGDTGGLRPRELLGRLRGRACQSSTSTL